MSDGQPDNAIDGGRAASEIVHYVLRSGRYRAPRSIQIEQCGTDTVQCEVKDRVMTWLIPEPYLGEELLRHAHPLCQCFVAQRRGFAARLVKHQPLQHGVAVEIRAGFGVVIRANVLEVCPGHATEAPRRARAVKRRENARIVRGKRRQATRSRPRQAVGTFHATSLSHPACVHRRVVQPVVAHSQQVRPDVTQKEQLVKYPFVLRGCRRTDHTDEGLEHNDARLVHTVE